MAAQQIALPVSVRALSSASSSVSARVAPAKAAFRGQAIAASARSVAASVSTKVVAAADTTEKVEEPKEFVPPTLDPNTPSPIFGGSTGGLLRKAQVEEFYVITWDAKKECIFEMPTGGAAIMRKGPNLLKLARKEQCLALLTQLRNKFKLNGCFYRVFPSGEVQYLHPKDGIYPEKVGKTRTQSNTNMRSIGKNVDPATIKFSGKLGGFEM